MVRRLMAVLFLLIISPLAHADDQSFQNSYRQGKAIAANHQSQVLSSMKGLKPENIVNGYTELPKEADYYNETKKNNNALDQHTREELKVNPFVKTMVDNINNRPQYKVDPQSNNIKNSVWILDHSDSITHGKTCRKIPACETTYENKVCQEEPGIRPHFCGKTLKVDVDHKSHDNHYPITVHLTSDRYYMAAVIDVTNGRLIDHGPHDSSAWIDGRLPTNVDCKTLQSAIVQSTIDNRTIDYVSFPSCSGSTINIHVTNATGSNVNGTITVDVVSHWVDTTINDTWVDSCLTLSHDAQCKIEDEKCTQGIGTRVMGGLPITRDCWATESRYLCQAHVNISNACKPLREKGCEQTGSVCNLQQDGQCLLYDQTLRCPLSSCSTQEKMLCTEEPSCINGDCTAHKRVDDPDFNQAIGSFGAMVDAAKHMDKNNQIIFQGEAMSCSKAPIGFLNCCADGGWGENLTAKCSEEEKKLQKNKTNRLVIEIPGDYCAHEVMGQCLSYRKRYCVYPTKLARLIQEKGRRDQLGMDFGTSKDPKCMGITPEDLQRIDFSKIDFTEIAEDMKNAMPVRDQNALTDRMKEHIQEMGRANG